MKINELIVITLRHSDNKLFDQTDLEWKHQLIKSFI